MLALLSPRPRRLDDGRDREEGRDEEDARDEEHRELPGGVDGARGALDRGGDEGPQARGGEADGVEDGGGRGAVVAAELERVDVGRDVEGDRDAVGHADEQWDDEGWRGGSAARSDGGERDGRGEGDAEEDEFGDEARSEEGAPTTSTAVSRGSRRPTTMPGAGRSVSRNIVERRAPALEPRGQRGHRDDAQEQSQWVDGCGHRDLRVAEMRHVAKQERTQVLEGSDARRARAHAAVEQQPAIAHEATQAPRPRRRGVRMRGPGGATACAVMGAVRCHSIG
mmetsp:Transcript_23713/g.94044  ORF Transcript_23713/g.94044 Transcript_23713/m.94044 type:complete len:281 (+) Transcript_23713:363-1205(+)